MEKGKINNILFISGLSLILLFGIVALIKGEFEPVTLIGFIAGFVITILYVILDWKNVKAYFTSKTTKYGINAIVYSLLVISILVVIQIIFTLNTIQIDLTKQKRYSLSDQTIKVLQGLKDTIEAYYFYSVKARNTQIEDTLKQYEKKSGKFKFLAVDADKNPSIAKKFNVDRYGIVVLSRKDKGSFEKIDQLTEEGITNGLIRISKETKKKIYFSKGHGEPSLDAPKNEKNGYSALKEELESYNYEVKDIELFNTDKVPDDCSILFIAGIQSDLFDREIKVLQNYIKRGGKIIISYAPMVNAPNLTNLLKSIGVVVHNDIVVDKLGTMFGGDVLMPIISTFDQHEITKGFRVALFFPMCRTFAFNDNITGVSSNSLAKTNTTSWGETDLAGIKKGIAKFDSGVDLQSPLIVAGIVNINNETFKPDWDTTTKMTQTKVAVLGSAEFINNTFLSASGNKDFILNTISYLAEEGDMISIRPKDRSFEPVFMSKIAGRMLFLIPTVLLPLIILGIGVMVFIKRRMA
ncbi:MAG: GldG family protein [Candidatus Goldbacteria bacterium]|nr:GldG family protein [Candidatus Goldiibacteriota bacterium]